MIYLAVVENDSETWLVYAALEDHQHFLLGIDANLA